MIFSVSCKLSLDDFNASCKLSIDDLNARCKLMLDDRLFNLVSLHKNVN